MCKSRTVEKISHFSWSVLFFFNIFFRLGGTVVYLSYHHHQPLNNQTSTSTTWYCKGLNVWSFSYIVERTQMCTLLVYKWIWYIRPREKKKRFRQTLYYYIHEYIYYNLHYTSVGRTFENYILFFVTEYCACALKINLALLFIWYRLNSEKKN